MTKKIRIMVVDDIGETRKNLQRLLELEEDMIVIGEAANGEEAICSAKELQPDIILMDINMPVLDGIQTTKRITTELSHAAIIILSVQQEQEYIYKAMAAGAKEYLIKPPGCEELTQTIRRVYMVENNAN